MEWALTLTRLSYNFRLHGKSSVVSEVMRPPGGGVHYHTVLGLTERFFLMFALLSRNGKCGWGKGRSGVRKGRGRP